MSRGLNKSNDSDFIKDKMISYFASYAFGFLYSYSDWCAFELGRHSDMTYDRLSRGYGYFTAPPIMRALGSKRVLPVGVYSEFYNEGPITSNIYTVFRGLIIDFGVVGALIFMFVLGLAFHGSSMRFYEGTSRRYRLWFSSFQ